MLLKSNIAFVFPGQGSQKVGMGKEFYEHATTKHLFEQADDALGFHLTKLMLSGDEAELNRTANTQPALVLTSYAALTYLKKQSGEAVADMSSCLAGHSLGEYAALLAGGVFNLETALKLVRKRGEAMQNAVPEGQGAMAAILGLTMADLSFINEQENCWVANDNAEGQVVISGAVDAVETVSQQALEKGAKRAVRLPVSAPFHCPLMQPAANVMAEALAQANMVNSQVPIVCNVTAQKAGDAQTLRENLVAQVTGSVRWRESMVHMAEQGITHLYELGTGKVLTGLAKRCDKRLTCVALNTPQDIDNQLEEWAKTAVA